MGARGYFERLRDDAKELDERRAKVQEMRAQLGSRGVRYGSVGGSGNHDAMAAVNHVIEAEQRLAIDQARHKIADSAIQSCGRPTIADLYGAGLINREQYDELHRVTITRILTDAKAYAETVASKQLGAWKTNRKKLGI